MGLIGHILLPAVVAQADLILVVEPGLVVFGPRGVENPLREALVARGAIVLSADGALVMDIGRVLLTRAGLAVDGGKPGARPYCRACLDWSERRPHLAGVLGTLLLERALQSSCVRRRVGSRALITAAGTSDILQSLGIG